jgi:glycosyltransferase involved in cell wall biosynthesis
MVKGLISVVLPTYNRVELLKERISELYAQTYQNFEVIIVDDGSTDTTQLFLNQYRLNNDHRIKTIKFEKNTGVVSIARNCAISWSNGEFIAPTDDDVMMFKDKFEILINNIGDAKLVYGDRIDLWTHNERRKWISIDDWNPNVGYGIDNGQILYRADVFKDIDFVYTYNACDRYLAKEIYNKFGKFKHVKSVVSTYIWHGENRCLKNPSEEELNRRHEVVKRMALEYEDKYFNKNFLIELRGGTYALR